MTGGELVPVERMELAWPEEALRAATLTEVWLRRYESAHTRAAYRRDLAAWLAWCHECDIEPGHAQPLHVDSWIDKQREDGAARTTIARRVSAVSSWYKYLIRNTAADAVPLATINPAETDARPKIDPDWTPTVGLDRREADRLIAAADADSVTAAALVRLLLVDGLRIGSVMEAKVTDLGHDRGHRVLTVATKGGGQRRVAIPPVVGSAIDAMLDERGQPADGPLFMTSRGRPLYESWVWRKLRALAKHAGLPQAGQLSPHSLRHTAITELFNAGASMRDVQDFAGHKDPRTTRRYDRNRHNLDRHGSYVLAGRFGASSGEGQA